MRTILSTTFIGALCGTIITRMVLVFLFIILTLPSLGVSGIGMIISGSLFYGLFITLFFGLLSGAIIGASIGCSQVIFRPKSQLTQQNVSSYNYNIYITICGACAGISLATFALIYLFTWHIGEQRQADRQMHAFVGQQACADDQNSVYFVYTDYPSKSEYICSTALASFMEKHTNETMNVHFIVTYDFGQVRGYYIDSIEDIPTEVLQGEGGAGTGCLDPVLPACTLSSPQQGGPW